MGHAADEGFGEQFRRIGGEGGGDRRHRGQRFDLHLDRRAGGSGLPFTRLGGDGGEDVTLVANAVDGDDRLILDKIAVERDGAGGNVVARQHRMHAGHGAGAAGVDAD